ncbi:MAG: phosphoesterase [Segetibacter sp.]|nr:phosphoesterase [Segetibacter sp.]
MKRKPISIMRYFYSVFLIVFSIIILESCSKQDSYVSYQPVATNYSAKVAADWMQALRKVVQSETKNPPQASRIYAYAAIGLYEAVMPGMPGYKSLEGQIPDLTNLPNSRSYGRLDYTIAANEALYQISSKVFGSLKPENLAMMEDLHARYLGSASATVSADVTGESKYFGKMIAEAVMNRANNDNFAATRNLSYIVPSPAVNPGFWAPTNAVLTPLEPHWGKIKCFAMAKSDACTILSAIPFNTDKNSAFYKQAEEVVTTSQHLTGDQKAIAHWWADNSGQTATPPGHWVAIADQLAVQRNMSLGKAAEMYAFLNIAMADAFISCWDEKFKLNLLRPVTYIRNFTPGNTSWSPLIATPPFPEYPSGHSVASAAAGEILTHLLGNSSFTDSSNVHLGLAPRTYNSFTEAANEAALSRLYGGIHFREAIENGMKQGKEVSKALFEKLKLSN